MLLTQSTLQTFIFNYCWVRAERWIINRKPGLFLAGGPLLWHSPVVRLRWWNPFATQNLSVQLSSQAYTNKTHRRYLSDWVFPPSLASVHRFTSVDEWYPKTSTHPLSHTLFCSDFWLPLLKRLLLPPTAHTHTHWWACFAKDSLNNESSSSLLVHLEGGSRRGQGGANSDSLRLRLSSLPPCLLLLLKEISLLPWTHVGSLFCFLFPDRHYIYVCFCFSLRWQLK